MQLQKLLYLFLITVFFIGCTVPVTPPPTVDRTPPPSHTETPPEATEPPTGTNTPENTETPVQPATATPEASATITPTPDMVFGDNLLINPGLYVDPSGLPQDGPGGTLRIADGYTFASNPEPDTHPCQPGQTTDCNPPESIKDFKPEAKPTDLDYRLFPFALDDIGQQWFCFQRVCDAVLYQTVAVPPGAVCRFEALTLDYQTQDWYQGHSDPPDSSGHASNWSIGISSDGLPPWESRDYIALDSWQEWDRAVLHSVEFQADSDQVTVYIRNERGYPTRHQESIVYGADLRCTGDAVGTPIPEPTPIVPPDATPFPTDCPDIFQFATPLRDYRTLYNSIRVRSCPDTSDSSNIIGNLAEGAIVSSDIEGYNEYEHWLYVSGECVGIGPCEGWVIFEDSTGKAFLIPKEMYQSSALGWNSNRNLGNWWYAGAPLVYITEDMDQTVAVTNDPNNRYVVFATWTLGDDYFRAGGDHKEPQAMAEEWAATVDYFIYHLGTRNPGPQWDKICVSGYNEPVFTSYQQADKYAEFELWRMILMDQRGLKACVGKFSTGTPDYPIYPAFYEMFRYAAENGHPILVHEYGGCIPLLWRGEQQNAAFLENTVNPFDLRPTLEAHLVGRLIAILYFDAYDTIEGEEPLRPIILVDEAGADFVGTGPPVSTWCGGVERGWKNWAKHWRAKWHDEAVIFLREMAVNPEFPPATRAYIAEIAQNDTLTDEQLNYAFSLAMDVIYRRYGVYGAFFVLGAFGWDDFSYYGEPARLWNGYINSYYQ